MFMFEIFPGSRKIVKKEILYALEAGAVCSILVTEARVTVVFPRSHLT